ncbi:odorant receptor 83a [Scaptodrosophila lebanonensis]|uniref:Odorant receptor n=1 Tax=Drosophila lebanonensis TaxID=7225 RepID=A0A6J2TEB1_DROLE|nr:odorant receptor 83a [Scaptodrosophila lebanonensis]
MSSDSVNADWQRRDLFKFIRYTMYVGGMYPLHYTRANKPGIITQLLAIIDWFYEKFSYFVSIHLLVLYICTTAMTYSSGNADLEGFVSCFMQTLIFTWTIAMQIYFRRVRPKLLNEIIEYINSKYQTRSAIGFSYVTMEGANKYSNIWMKTFCYCCYIGTIFWLVLPIAYGDKSLPLSCWYPFDYKQPVVYEIVFFLQSMGQITVAAAFASSSGFYMVLSILILGQYDVLFCTLKNVIATTYVEMGASMGELSNLQAAQSVTNAELGQYSYCVEEQTPLDQLLAMRHSRSCDFPTAFKRCFKRCLKQHRYILVALEKMELFFNQIWFFKIFERTLLMCLVGFVCVKSNTTNSVMRTASLGQYLLLIFYELFIICYFAELLYQNSQRCGDALWRSPWHLHLLDIRSDYNFFMLNSKRQFQLSAGKMYYINVDRFRRTITMAFSFLTLLQKMDARN